MVTEVETGSGPGAEAEGGGVRTEAGGGGALLRMLEAAAAVLDTVSS